MWTTTGQYLDPGMDHYKQKYQEQVLKNLGHKAHALGLELVPLSQDPQNTPSFPTLTT
jgi:predicted acetyltransferase